MHHSLSTKHFFVNESVSSHASSREYINICVESFNDEEEVLFTELMSFGGRKLLIRMFL
jgi:hypothetical protein